MRAKSREAAFVSGDERKRRARDAMHAEASARNNADSLLRVIRGTGARNNNSGLCYSLKDRHGDALIPFWGYGSHRRLLRTLPILPLEAASQD
jgi:hypothetical protein